MSNYSLIKFQMKTIKYISYNYNISLRAMNEQFEIEIKEKMNQPTNKRKYTLYCYRWIILINMSVACFLNGATLTIFTSIASKCTESYSINLTIFSINNFLYMIMYPISTLFLVDFMQRKFGLKATVSTGLIFLIVCDWLRANINSPFNKYFLFVTVSGFFGGISQPFVINSYTEVAGAWFSIEERIMVTSIFSILTSLGSAVGIAYPMFFIGDINKISSEKFKESLAFSLNIFAIMSTICFVINILFLRSRPLTPPTRSSAKNCALLYNPGASNYCNLFKNCNFLIEVVIFSIFYGSLYVYSICIEMVFRQFGLDPLQSTIIGVSITISGIISVFIVGYILSQTNAYKCITIVISLISLTGFSSLIASAFYHKIILVYVSSAVFGIGIVPIIAVCFQFGCELAYPVSSNLVSGFQLSTSRAFALLISLAYTYILPSSNKPISIFDGLLCSGIIIGAMIIGIFLTFLLTEDLRRLRADRRKTTSMSVGGGLILISVD